MDRILDDGLQAARRRERPDPEPLARGRAIPRSRPRSRTSSRGISKLDAVQNVRSPLARGQRGPDREGRARRARRVRHPRRQGQGRRQDRSGRQARRRTRSGRIPSSSSASSATRAPRRASRRRSRTTSAKAGTLSLPITLIILVLAFGALVAAGIPLLLALTAVFATFGLVALPSHVAAGRDWRPPRWCS